MTASVVPCKEHLRHADRKAVIENALKIFSLIIVFITYLFSEERRRRHLLGIAYDYGFTASCDNTYRLTCRQLARLIENNDIKHSAIIRIQELRA